MLYKAIKAGWEARPIPLTPLCFSCRCITASQVEEFSVLCLNGSCICFNVPSRVCINSNRTLLQRGITYSSWNEGSAGLNACASPYIAKGAMSSFWCPLPIAKVRFLVFCSPIQRGCRFELKAMYPGNMIWALRRQDSESHKIGGIRVPSAFSFAIRPQGTWARVMIVFHKDSVYHFGDWEFGFNWETSNEVPVKIEGHNLNSGSCMQICRWTWAAWRYTLFAT